MKERTDAARQVSLPRTGSVSHAITVTAVTVVNAELREELVRLRRVFQERWVSATADQTGAEAQRLLVAVDRVVACALEAHDVEASRLASALIALRMGRERIAYFEQTRGWQWLAKSPMTPVLEDYWERIQRVFDAAGLGRVTTFVGLAQSEALPGEGDTDSNVCLHDAE